MRLARAGSRVRSAKRPCRKRAAALPLAASVLCLAVGAWAFDPSTDHTCVAYCDGDPVEIERVPAGPPVVIWVRPSPAGSAQSGFRAMGNPSMDAVLNDWSQTSHMLYSKGQTALRQGDQKSAALYCQAALNHNPPPDELSDIQSCLRQAQQMFDNSDGTKGAMPAFKFKKIPTPSMPSYPAIQLPSALYDPGRRDLEPLRKELEPMLIDQQEDLERLRSLQAQGAPQTGDVVKRAEARLYNVQTRLKQHITAAKIEYHLEK